MDGGKGSDTISGDDGADTILQIGGYDVISGDAGNDYIDGGAMAIRSRGMTVTLLKAVLVGFDSWRYGG